MAKLFTGNVISTKMQKTIVVEVKRHFRHPTYKKVMSRTKKYKAHYDGKDIHEGDMVVIKETRPLSKEKNFIFVEKVIEKPNN